MFRCTKDFFGQSRSMPNAIDGADLYFFTGVFSSDIYEHKTPCAHWPGHHQWIHYEPEQKSYSPLKERSQYEGEKVDFMSHREDWFVNDHLEELRCRKGWLRQTQALFRHYDLRLYSPARPNSDPPPCQPLAPKVKYRPPSGL